MARPAVVGDQHIAVVKQHQQLLQTAGVAHQAVAQRVVAQAQDVLRQRLVFGQANHRHGVTLLAQSACQFGVMRRRPSADGQQAATGVHQHPLRRGHQGRVVAAQGLGIVAQLAGRKHQRQTAVGGHGVHGHAFAARRVARANRIDQGQKLLADVAIRVVGNGRVHERAPVQALLGVRRETSAPTRPTGIGQQGADAREQFAVDDRVQAQMAQLAHHAPDVGQQPEHGAVVQAMQMGVGGELQHARDLLVAGQLQDVDLRLRVLLADAGKHRAGQHHRAHL